MNNTIDALNEEFSALNFFGSGQWPNELKLIAVNYLSPKDLLTCRVVCKLWLNSLENELYWKIKIPSSLSDCKLDYNGINFRSFVRGGVHLIQTLDHLEKFLLDDDQFMKFVQYIELYQGRIDTDLGFHYTITNKMDYPADNLDDIRTFVVKAMEFDCPYLAIPTKYFEDNENFYLVFDNQFEDLQKYIKSISVEEYNEKLVVKLVRQLIHAIQFLHERNFCLISYFGGVDFGIKRNHNGDIQLQIINYTYSIAAQTSLIPYVSPERLKSPKSPLNLKSDLFTLGSLVFYLLNGLPPYSGLPGRVLYKIRNFQNYEFQDPNTELSDLAKDFILRLLKRNPEDRMTLEEALNHPWLTNPEPKSIPPLRSAYTRFVAQYDE